MSWETVRKHRGSGPDTWLPGEEDNPSAVCRWKENNTPWRNKSAKAGGGHRLGDQQAPTVQTSVHPGSAPPAPAARTCAEGPATPCRCRRCLLGDCLTMLAEGMVLLNRGYNILCVPAAHPTTVFITGWNNPKHPYYN